MNNYITLDGQQYKTEAESWKPLLVKPSTVRVNLDGSTDVTYGPAMPVEWNGRIIAPVTGGGSWGDIDDLLTTMAKAEAVAFVDHFGAPYSVHVLGPFDRVSRVNMWDSASNEWLVQVRLVKV
jgi:hypothetical protein